MLCESCRENPATVHLTTVANGEVTERHLCAACIAKHKQALTIAGINGLLGGILRAGATQQTVPDIRCSRCGLTYEQFRKVGMLGCAQCYADFREQLRPMLQRVHGRVQHAGRLPQHADEAIRSHRHMKALREEMEQAIAQENFERAAVLRDEIRAMQPAEEADAP